LLSQADALPTAEAAPDLYLVNRGAAAEAAAVTLACLLRRRGLRVEMDGSGAAFGKQFKRADRSGAPWAAVLGEGELERQAVLLKPLRGQPLEERLCPLADLDTITQLLRP
jgi:histidyl-tRNA synthetase